MAISTQDLELIKKDKSLEAIKLLLETFKEKYDLSNEEILDIISGKKEESIPIAVFSNSKLSALEIIVKYIKENLGKSYHEIAVLLNRNDRTIWSTYNNSLKKFKEKRDTAKTKAALAELKKAAQRVEEGEIGVLMPAIIGGVKANVTIGEMMDVLKEVFGWGLIE